MSQEKQQSSHKFIKWNNNSHFKMTHDKYNENKDMLKTLL